MFITIAAIYEFMRQDVRLGVLIEREEKVIAYAQKGATETIGLLTSNCALWEWHRLKTGRTWLEDSDKGFYYIYESDIPDSTGKPAGHWMSKARQLWLSYLKPDYQSCYEIVTKAWPKDKKTGADRMDMMETIYTFITLENVGEYFLAIQNADLVVGAGADFRNAAIYGYNVRFRDASDTVPINSDHPIRVKRVDYVGSYHPNEMDDGADAVAKYNDHEIIINPDFPGPYDPDPAKSRPSQIQREPRFPTLAASDLDYYKNEALKRPDNGTLSDADASNKFVSHEVWPPYCPNCSGPTCGTCGSLGETSYTYYYGGTSKDVIMGNMTVHGQVILATSQKVIIRGPIKKASQNTWATNWTEFYPELYSSQYKYSWAHQMVILAAKGVQIDYGAIPSGSTLKIEAYIISPDATIWVDTTNDPTHLINPANQVIWFNGAMVLNRTPDLAQWYNVRVFDHDTSLFGWTRPPLRGFYKIFAQVNFGGDPKLFGDITPVPTYIPTWVYTYTPTYTYTPYEPTYTPYPTESPYP